MIRLRGTLVAAAVPLVLIGACAQPAADGAGVPAAGTPASSAATARGDDLVLRTELFGGFLPAELVVGALPTVSVYADGRVITQGPVPAVYPGPALPNLQEQSISPEQVRELVAASEEAGVRNGTDFGKSNVVDAPSTRVVVTTPQGTRTVTVDALDETQAQDPMLTPAQAQARTRLSTFVRRLSDLQTGQSPVRAYQPDAVAVLARPWTSTGGGEPPPPAAQAWPGPELPGTYLSPNFKIGCVVATGAEKDEVLAAARTATAITPWTAGKDRYLITFRPLLPDEKDCAVLKGRA